MAETLNVMTAALDISGMSGDLVRMPVVVAPSAANGGGITILDAKYWCGTATNAGTAYTLALLTYTGGTTLSGTVAAAIGGTASVFTSESVNSFTISTAKVSAGDWVMVYKDEQGAANSPTRGVVVVQYINGV